MGTVEVPHSTAAQGARTHKNIQESSQTFTSTRLVAADLLSEGREDPCKKTSWHKQNRDQNPLVVVFTPRAAARGATDRITSREHVPCKAPSGFDAHILPHPGLLLQPGMELSSYRMWQGTALLPTHIRMAAAASCDTRGP